MTSPTSVSSFSLGTPVTLPLPLGGEAALAAGGLRQVVGLRTTAVAQRVCLVAALAES